VEFKVPPEFEVLQSPKNLPPVFNGEKMVVFGILKRKTLHTPSQGANVNGTAVLKGSVLGKVVEHSISFTFPPIPIKAPALPSVHHLAGKALIKDWQDEDRLKEEIVKLSINSSVVSSHTAFIAIDEENTEPVSGAMKTWDIQAEFKPQPPQYRFCSAGANLSQRRGQVAPEQSRIQALQSQVDEVKAVMEVNIDKVCQRSDHLDDLSEKSEALNSSAFAFQKQASKKKSGGFFSSVGSLLSDLFSSSSSTVETSSEEQWTSHDNALSMVPDSTYQDPIYAPQAPKPGAQSTSLSSFITAQQADGSWKLGTSLTQLFGKSQKDLEEACPTECKGTMAMVWATILVLSLLRMKYSSQQEEWELVAMKAESWVKRQTLPSGVSLEGLYKAADKII